jgi:ribosome recycling factor
MKKVFKECKERMDKSIEALKNELNRIRTGRASSSLLDGIRVSYYGTPTPLNHVATISVPESRLIVIQPWDPKMIGEIEKAITKSGLGLNPTSDGKVIRISIPALTEERRKELLKVVKRHAEDAKVAIRNIRRDTNDQLKKMEKNKEISEDDLFRAQDDVQKIVDEYIEKINEILSIKEKEIM